MKPEHTGSVNVQILQPKSVFFIQPKLQHWFWNESMHHHYALHNFCQETDTNGLWRERHSLHWHRLTVLTLQWQLVLPTATRKRPREAEQETPHCSSPLSHSLSLSSANTHKSWVSGSLEEILDLKLLYKAKLRLL